ncbi:hypothetical protein D3C81_1355200 [compost metagenome]
MLRIDGAEPQVKVTVKIKGQVLDQRLPNTVIRGIGVALMQLAVPAAQSFGQTRPFGTGQASA